MPDNNTIPFLRAGTPLPFLCMLLAATVLNAEPSIMEKARSVYNKNTTMSTDFELTIFWKIREKTEKTRGTLLYGPGDKFRVTAGSSVWVSNGQTYWQYSKNTNQVVIKQLLDVDLSMHPSQVLSTYLQNKQYAEKERKKRSVTLQAVADSTSPADAESITLTIDSRTGIISTLTIIDNQGNTNTYSFSNTRFSFDPEPSTFEFSPPEGVDVLDVRG